MYIFDDSLTTVGFNISMEFSNTFLSRVTGLYLDSTGSTNGSSLQSIKQLVSERHKIILLAESKQN